MEKTYIFGHRNPDTDSVAAAISLSYLKNRLGYNKTIKAVVIVSTLSMAFIL